MLKVAAILVVLCGISAGYSVPPYNAFMFYQQPMYGLQYQNQQLRSQQRGLPSLRSAKNVELPVQDDQAVESAAEDIPAEQIPVEDEPQDDDPAVNDQEAEEPIDDEPVPAASNVPAVVTDKKKKTKKTVRQDSAEDDSPAAAIPNTYFPINFGSTNGGSIAIANSYSTGKGGSAVSTATAYGSPAVEELRRVAPVAGQLRRRPAKQF